MPNKIHTAALIDAAALDLPPWCPRTALRALTEASDIPITERWVWAVLVALSDDDGDIWPIRSFAPLAEKAGVTVTDFLDVIRPARRKGRPIRAVRYKRGPHENSPRWNLREGIRLVMAS